MTRLLLLTLMLPAIAGAQETPMKYRKGAVLEGGERRAPTPITAMCDLLANAAAWDQVGEFDDAPEDTPDGEHATVAVLRQTFEARPAAELDAFAEELGRLFRDGTEYQSENAFLALWWAAGPSSDGTPYASAVDVFIRIYESFEGRVELKSNSALRGVLYTGGLEYVRSVFNTSEQPPICTWLSRIPELTQPELATPYPNSLVPNTSTWCVAGWLLLEFGEGPHPDEYYPRCEQATKGADG